MEAITPEIAKLFATKELRWRKLASLPYPEKVKAVVQLQQMVAPIFRVRGRHVRVGQITNSPETNRQ